MSWVLANHHILVKQVLSVGSVASHRGLSDKQETCALGTELAPVDGKR